MKNKIILSLLLMFSQLFPVGEAGAIFLLIAPGASAAGTGEAQVAKADDSYASYYNPAGLGFQNRSGFSGMHVNWLPNLADDLYYEFLAFKQPIGYGTVGGHLIYLNLGEQQGMDEFGNPTETFKSMMWAATASYGAKLTSTSSIGLNFKVFHQKLANTATGSESGKPYSTDFAFDIGYLKQFSKYENGIFNLGLSISNIGQEIDFIDNEQADPAPTNLKFGLYKQFIINDYNKVGVIFDINRLMVAKYASMDWDNDGVIDVNSKEEGYSDPWYKAVVTCWLDDWYYKYNRDYDGDRIIGGYDQVDGGFMAFNGGSEYTQFENPNLEIAGYTQDLNDPILNASGCNSGLCSQESFYYNGYNWFTDIQYLDNSDSWTDLNQDGVWNPAEPFYDNGDGIFESINTLPGGNFTDLNSNNEWDAGEPFHDDEGNVIFEGYSLNYEDYNFLSAGNNQYWIYYNANPGSMLLVQTENGVITSIDAGDQIYNEEEGFVDWDNDQMYDNSEPWVDVNGNGGFDTGYSKNNKNGKKEVGSKDDYSFSDELKELIANIGLEYWYTDNFVLRAGYIHDREGKIMNPTFGAGIKFGQYAFDFGYTAGDEGHARANTMFFSISMDLSLLED
tara:strand:- start:8283 stop:10136 length:1854 start_codon:yes stop_codon:yes gene_type:complete